MAQKEANLSAIRTLKRSNTKVSNSTVADLEFCPYAVKLIANIAEIVYLENVISERINRFDETKKQQYISADDYTLVINTLKKFLK